MRPGNQSKQRMRGRGRKGPNPLSRTYESNGPDVKIRGTALHVAEKYQQLARDAQASGDRIMSENYLQHAEHYLRIIAAAQGHVQPVLQSDRDDDDDQDAPVQSAPERRERHDRGDRHERHNRGDGSGRGESYQQADLVSEDSPQPFIDEMPVLDNGASVNGRGAAPAASEDEDEDGRMRRRPRGTRGRGIRRGGPEESVAEPVVEAAAQTKPAEAVDEGSADKPKARRSPRGRRPKSEAAPEQETATAGE